MENPISYKDLFDPALQGEIDGLINKVKDVEKSLTDMIASVKSQAKGLGEALSGYLVSPSTPRRRAAGVLPQPLPPPCWIKVRETSPGCTCVERGGAVVRH